MPLTELAPPLPLVVVLLPLVAGGVRQRAAPRVGRGGGQGRCAVRSRARVRNPRSTSSGSLWAVP
ncbi:hypothetical protein BN2537_265 [Streptomyces venezuelae]|nr:hypothetical protein BN2537_265 [Streptomyces venezuelae]